MDQEIAKRKNRLLELNEVANQLYDYVEMTSIKLTRRRLLIIQTLLSVDSNTNAVFHLIDSSPRFADGAHIVLRSILDVNLTSDWVLKQRSNKRLWKWLRDDRKTLHMQLNNIVNLKVSNPKLDDMNYPVSEWQKTLLKVEKELNRFSKKAGVTPKSKETPLFTKAKDLGEKTQLIYNTVFWLLSSKTHASQSGMQDLITLNPVSLRRRDTLSTLKENEHALRLLDTALTWYAANIHRATNYLKTPQANNARDLYEKTLSREYDLNT